MDLTPPVGQRVPVEGVGGRVVMGQRVVVRGWQRGPQSRLAVVVWRAWMKQGQGCLYNSLLTAELRTQMPGRGKSVLQGLDPRCPLMEIVCTSRALREGRAVQQSGQS